MESKIKQYVNYQLRYDERPDVEDLKEEIIANLIDRYHDNLKDGTTPEEAYVEAIKSMGDFSENNTNQIPLEYGFKPSFSDIFLVCSAITSVFALLLTLFSSIIGILTVLLSMLFFGSASHYLYSYSQYVRKEELDIEKHHVLLRKIFKYVKTNFIFWAISLSIVITKLVAGRLATLWLMDQDIQVIFVRVVWTYIIVFIIFFSILSLIFLYVYHRIMTHYKHLTGDTIEKGKVGESINFVFGDMHANLVKLFSRYIIPILTIIAYISLQFSKITYVEEHLKVYSLVAAIPFIVVFNVRPSFLTKGLVIFAFVLGIFVFLYSIDYIIRLLRGRTQRSSNYVILAYWLYIIIFEVILNISTDTFQIEFHGLDQQYLQRNLYTIGMIVYLIHLIFRFFTWKKEEGIDR